MEAFTATCQATAARRLAAPIRREKDRVRCRRSAERLTALVEWIHHKPGPATAWLRRLPPSVIGYYSTSLVLGAQASAVLWDCGRHHPDASPQWLLAEVVAAAHQDQASVDSPTEYA